MKSNSLKLAALILILVSCVEPEQVALNEDGESGANKKGVVGKSNGSGVASKNFLQINNTFASLTKVSSGDTDVLAEFDAVKVQLPSTSNPEGLTGFHQIASTRLAFAYCEKFIERDYAQYSALTEEDSVKKLIDGFVDLDYETVQSHKSFYENVLAIRQDADGLVIDNNATNKRKKLLKMSCAAILSSSYVTMI